MRRIPGRIDRISLYFTKWHDKLASSSGCRCHETNFIRFAIVGGIIDSLAVLGMRVPVQDHGGDAAVIV